VESVILTATVSLHFFKHSRHLPFAFIIYSNVTHILLSKTRHPLSCDAQVFGQLSGKLNVAVQFVEVKQDWKHEYKSPKVQTSPQANTLNEIILICSHLIDTTFCNFVLYISWILLNNLFIYSNICRDKKTLKYCSAFVGIKQLINHILCSLIVHLTTLPVAQTTRSSTGKVISEKRVKRSCRSKRQSPNFSIS
jgi:hypothetical protein